MERSTKDGAASEEGEEVIPATAACGSEAENDEIESASNQDHIRFLKYQKLPPLRLAAIMLCVADYFNVMIWLIHSGHGCS